MKQALWLGVSLEAALLLGCQRVPADPPSARTAPFLSPGERARLPVEERDDPYTQMHTQPGSAPADPRF